MCGIIHSKLADIKKAVAKIVIKRYNKQKNRGNQGYGYVEIKNGFVVAEIRTQTEKEILEKLEKSTADEIMFHHRYPTSTPNLIEATHPIKVNNECLEYNYYVIHNGIISNDTELREDHLKNGFSYTTNITKKWITAQNTYLEEMWNDSEALAIDLALAIEANSEIKAKGSIAFIALQFHKTTGKAIALYYGRNNGNPLCLEQDKSFFSLSSESGKSIKTDILYRFDYQTKKITEEAKKIGNYTTSTTGYGFSDWEDYTESIYNPRSPSENLEEEDFDIEDWEEMEMLEIQIDRAYQESNYDLAQELEMDLELLKIKVAKTKKKTKKWLY